MSISQVSEFETRRVGEEHSPSPLCLISSETLPASYSVGSGETESEAAPYVMRR
jgi:hypothetical protein